MKDALGHGSNAHGSGIEAAVPKWHRDGMGGYIHRSGWRIEPSGGKWNVINPVSGAVADSHKSLSHMKRTYG